MKLVPLFDRVVLKQLVAEETTKSGIVLPGQAKEKPQQAEVIAVGPGGVVDGKEIKMQVKPGDKVIYSKYSGTEVKVEEEDYIIVKQNDILAVNEYAEKLYPGPRVRSAQGGLKFRIQNEVTGKWLQEILIGGILTWLRKLNMALKPEKLLKLV